jgi:hypothetical protein
MTENPLGRDFIRIKSETSALLIDAEALVGILIGPNNVTVHYRGAKDSVYVDGFTCACKVETGSLMRFLEEAAQ